MDWNIVFQLAAIVGVSVGVYTAIKSDLAAMHERINAADARITVVAAEANKAHDRIDGLYRGDHRV